MRGSNQLMKYVLAFHPMTELQASPWSTNRTSPHPTPTNSSLTQVTSPPSFPMETLSPFPTLGRHYWASAWICSSQLAILFLKWTLVASHLDFFIFRLTLTFSYSNYSPDPSEVNLTWKCLALLYEKEVISSNDPEIYFIASQFIQ